MKPLNGLDDGGARRVVEAMINHAIDDYRALENRGLICSGRVLFSGSLKNEISGYTDAAEVEELVMFFKRGGMLDQWIRLAGIQISPQSIRRKLGIIA